MVIGAEGYDMLLEKESQGKKQPVRQVCWKYKLDLSSVTKCDPIHRKNCCEFSHTYAAALIEFFVQQTGICQFVEQMLMLSKMVPPTVICSTSMKTST